MCMCDMGIVTCIQYSILNSQLTESVTVRDVLYLLLLDCSLQDRSSQKKWVSIRRLITVYLVNLEVP